MLDIKKILERLNEYSVKYIIVGGTAAIAHGSVRLTFDLDLCYARNKDNLENMVEALKPFNPYLRGVEKNLPFIFDVKTLEMGLNFTFSTDVGDIDLLGEISGLGSYNEVLKFAEKLKIYEMECYVLSLEGLIKNKRVIGRQKDKETLIELEALFEMHKNHKN